MELHLPTTQDVLEYAYPNPEIRRTFEGLYGGYVGLASADGEVNFDFLDDLFDGRGRKGLTELILDDKEAREEDFRVAVAQVVNMCTDLKGFTNGDVEEQDYVEFLFYCGEKRERYERKILVPRERAVTRRDSVRAARAIDVERQYILYSDGREQIQAKRLMCGNCHEPMNGQELSRNLIIRPRLEDEEKRQKVEQVVTKAFESLGLSTRRKRTMDKSQLWGMILDAVSGKYPDVRRGRSGSITRVSYERIYEIFENISRGNIPEDYLFEHFNGAQKHAVLDAIEDTIDVPLAVLRRRVKRDRRLAAKVEKYLGRKWFYEHVKHYGPRKNPIFKPVDTFGVRVMFGSVTECYRLEEELDYHPNFTLLEKHRKDRIAEPKDSGYQSLHVSALYTGGSANGGIIIEFQIRTHEMDAAAEDPRKKLASSKRDRHLREKLDQANPPYVRHLVSALLDPEGYREDRKLRPVGSAA